MRKKRFFSALLALLMAIQLLPGAAAAGNRGASVSGIEVVRQSGLAAVSIDAGGNDALLLLALYTRSLQLVETKAAEVSGGEQTVTLTFSHNLRDPYFIKAMLVDRNTCVPLCASCMVYNLEQVLTVDDFDPDLVLNFDGRRDENFAVMTEGVVPLYAGTDFTRFETEDDVNFVLYGVSAGAAKQLGEGARIILFDGKDSCPVEAGAVSVSGSTVTVRGRDLTEDCLGDFFQYFTVDRNLDDLNQAEIQCGDGVRRVEQASLLAEGWLDIPYIFGFQLDADVGQNIHVTGEVSATLRLHMSFLYRKDLLGQPYIFYDVSADNAYEVELALQGVLDNTEENGEACEIPLVRELRIPFPEAPFVEFVAGVTMPISLKLEVGFKWTGTIHSRYRMTGDNRNAPSFTQNTTVEDCTFKAEAAFTLDGGVRLRVAIEAFQGLLYVEIAAQAGEEARVALAEDLLDKVSVRHDCDLCLDGILRPYIKCWVEIGGKIPRLEYKLLHKEFSRDLDREYFYISINGGKVVFDWGKCPNIAYLCTFSAKDNETGLALPDATIRVVPAGGSGDSLLAASGLGGYLHAGEYEATARCGGYAPASTHVTVQEPRNTILRLIPSEGDVNEPVHGQVTGTFANGIAESYKLYPDGYFCGTSPSTTPGMLSRDYRAYSWQLNANTRNSIVQVDLSEGHFDLVGAHAFRDCYYLTSVDLDLALTRILPYAFQNCPNLTSIYLPSGTKVIGEYAFQGCSKLVTPLRLSSATINQFAFADCTSLRSCAIGGGEIGTGAFSNCTALASVSLENITAIPNSAFVNCRALEYASIPGTLTSIGDAAFGGCVSLRELEIPDGVTSLGKNAVSKSGVSSLTIPGSVMEMGEYFASGCPALETVTFEEGFTAIPRYSFNGCPMLSQINLPNSLRSIGAEAFRDSISLTRVTVPNSVETFGSGVFSGCITLRDVKLTPGLESIGEKMFHMCESLREITIPESVTAIGNSAFADSGLRVINYEGTEAQWNAISIGAAAIDSGVAIRFLGKS